MNITSEKGLIFGFDLLIAFLIICLMLYFMLFSLNEVVKEQKNYLNELELKNNAIYLMDSLVKNSDKENPLKGASALDFQKRRTKENVLDYELLKKINSKNEFKLKKLSIFWSDEEEILFDIQRENENCIALSRFVWIQKGLIEKKAIITGVFCSE